MRYFLSCLFSLLLLSGSSAAQVSFASPPEQRDDGWSTETLEASGFDADRMQRLTEKLEAGGFPNTHIVVIEHDGKLVYEKYLSGQDQNWGHSIGHRQFDSQSLHDLRSVSKSVTSLLLGIALGDGFEAALSRPIVEYFPEYAHQVAAGFEKITLYQVLTMSTGMEWNEMDVPYSSQNNDEIRLYNTEDPIQFVFARPMRGKPGESWYYNGGTTMILADLVTKLTGRKFLEFAEKALFEPLGIDRRAYQWRGLGIWRKRPSLPSAASGLRLRARDLAKIGSLMLHDGRWQDKQIVPVDWVRASSQRYMEQTYSIWSHSGVYGYGYQWWHGEFKNQASEYTAISGVGYGGQRLFVIPKHKLVVTIFAGNYGTGKWRISEDILTDVMAAAP
jgi:CubicO group peptidase (beta-lactamase class C family)